MIYRDMPNCCKNRVCALVASGLVRPSATMSVVGIWRIRIMPCSAMSRVKMKGPEVAMRSWPLLRREEVCENT
jgi:hypothetical protein